MSQPPRGAFLQKGAAGPLVSPAGRPSPPIVAIGQVLARFLAISYRFISRTTLTLAFSLLAPISLLYSPIRYLLAPVTVLIGALLDVLVFTPYSIVVILVHNLYPIYVFVGASLIFALAFGFVARTLSTQIMRTLFASRSRRPRKAQEQMPEVLPTSGPKEKDKEKSAIRSMTPRTRTRKRVSIKDERGR